MTDMKLANRIAKALAKFRRDHNDSPDFWLLIAITAIDEIDSDYSKYRIVSDAEYRCIDRYKQIKEITSAKLSS